MNHVPLVLALFVLTPAAALAHGEDAIPRNLMARCCDAPVCWASRLDPQDARIAITSEDGNATLLLTDDVLAVQLSDHLIHRVKREFRAKEDEDEDNAIAQAVKTAVLTTVQTLISHSAECPIRDLSDVDYRHGTLIITTEDGDRILEHMVVADRNVMESFSEHDARAFVREFRRLKDRERHGSQ